jgi:hypothetical protein
VPVRQAWSDTALTLTKEFMGYWTGVASNG